MEASMFLYRPARKPHPNKLTDRQREVIAAAKNKDRSKRVVGANCAKAAELLAERGYITLPTYADGYRVELTKRARKTSWALETWRRFPMLPTARAPQGVTAQRGRRPCTAQTT
jgi:hypothetical protein